MPLDTDGAILIHHDTRCDDARSPLLDDGDEVAVVLGGRAATGTGMDHHDRDCLLLPPGPSSVARRSRRSDPRKSDRDVSDTSTPPTPGVQPRPTGSSRGPWQRYRSMPL